MEESWISCQIYSVRKFRRKKNLQEQEEIKDLKTNIDFEYTTRETPQNNYLAELRFLVLANKGKAMVYHGNVPTAMRY